MHEKKTIVNHKINVLTLFCYSHMVFAFIIANKIVLCFLWADMKNVHFDSKSLLLD